ncbi:MAG TPA: hypothetical protein VNL15_06975 [Dehalococcoidia bacterium]|nr:hypothetical protein [Dehalococcoidia bacterium]
MTQSAPQGIRIVAFNGASLPETIDLAPGLTLAPSPDSTATLEVLAAPGSGWEAEEATAIARRVKETIWLASGALLRKTPAAVTSPALLTPHEASLLPGLFARLQRAREASLEQEDSDTSLHCRLALGQLEAVLEADPLTAALSAHSAIERLLTRDRQEVSRLPERASRLVAIADADRVNVKNFLLAANNFQAAVQRGRIPDHITRCRLLGRKVSRDLIDYDFSWYGEDARRVIAQRCGEVLRRVLLCFFNLALILHQDGSAGLGLSRKQIIDLLDTASHEGEGVEDARQRLQANARSLLAG